MRSSAASSIGSIAIASSCTSSYSGLLRLRRRRRLKSRCTRTSFGARSGSRRFRLRLSPLSSWTVNVRVYVRVRLPTSLFNVTWHCARPREQPEYCGGTCDFSGTFLPVLSASLSGPIPGQKEAMNKELTVTTSPTTSLRTQGDSEDSDTPVSTLSIIRKLDWGTSKMCVHLDVHALLLDRRRKRTRSRSSAMIASCGEDKDDSDDDQA